MRLTADAAYALDKYQAGGTLYPPTGRSGRCSANSPSGSERQAHDDAAGIATRTPLAVDPPRGRGRASHSTPCPATRIALLRLLATAEAVVCFGRATDLSARAGIAVAVEHQQARDTLIIDGAGRVLAHKSTDVGSPPGMGKPAPRLRLHTLILDRSEEPTIDTAQATR